MAHSRSYEQRVIVEEAGFRTYLEARLKRGEPHPLREFRDQYPGLWPDVEAFLLSAFRSGVALGTDVLAEHKGKGNQ